MRPDQEEQGQPPIPDFIPESLLGTYEDDARDAVQFARLVHHTKAADRDAAASRGGRALSLGRLRWALAAAWRRVGSLRGPLATVALAMVMVASPFVWLATVPSHFGWFWLSAIITSVIAAWLSARAIRWLWTNRSRYMDWLPEER